jgi:hypothetical protein
VRKVFECLATEAVVAQEGRGCRVLSRELGRGSGRSEEAVVVKCLAKSSGGNSRSEAVRRRSCRHSKSDACKERGC